MRKHLLIISFLLLVGGYGFGQIQMDCSLSTKIKGDRCGFNGGLIDNDRNILVTQIGCFNEPIRHSNIVIIDLNKCKILSEFKIKPWSYMHRSFFYNDSLIYINIRAEAFSIYRVYSIYTVMLIGKVKIKDSPMKEKRSYLSGKSEICYENKNLIDYKIILDNYSLELDSLNRVLINSD